MTRRRLLLALAVVGALPAIVWTARSLSRERVVVGEPVTPTDRVPLTSIDHAAWDRLLKKYVRDDGLVDYAAWHDSTEDREALEAYLAGLSAVDTDSEWPREEELAYWINAYNALTIYGILREYPTDSIRNFTPRFWGYHIWHDLLLPVGDELVSLDEIEHHRLRPMGEYRIHFALVCASRGCPPLRREAYQFERLDEQLTDQARRFMNDRSKFRLVRPADSKVSVIEWSPILAWFGADFGPDRATRMYRLAKWVDDENVRKAAKNFDTPIARIEYDWRLNDAALVVDEPPAEQPTDSEEAPMPESTESGTSGSSPGDSRSKLSQPEETPSDE